MYCYNLLIDKGIKMKHYTVSKNMNQGIFIYFSYEYLVWFNFCTNQWNVYINTASGKRKMF